MWTVEYVDMTNIQELQLLMDSVGGDDDLEGFSCFFQQNPPCPLPLLDRLFVRVKLAFCLSQSQFPVPWLTLTGS